MADETDWNVPRTEAGLQQVLSLLAEARARTDLAQEGRALLELAFLVKWVRSDNSQSPFERSHTLALEALEVFRRLGDPQGQISALLLALPFEPARESAAMLEQAQSLAEMSGDRLGLARVTAARARQMGMVDRGRAAALNHEALALFRELGHAAGMAGCHFSLSILEGTDAEKRQHALEAARLNRESGNFDQAGKSVMVALMNVESENDVIELGPEIRRALEDAQAAEDRDTEARCYRYLARITEAKGDLEETVKFLSWERQIMNSDGLSPAERWQEDGAMLKKMIAMTKKMGNPEMTRLLQEELERRQSEKP